MKKTILTAIAVMGIGFGSAQAADTVNQIPATPDVPLKAGAPVNRPTTNNTSAMPASTFGKPASAASSSSTSYSRQMSSSSSPSSSFTNTTVASERFIENINNARVALALKNTGAAKSNITQAQSALNYLKNASGDRTIRRVESGRIVYSEQGDNRYHYFPIETGPVKVKTLSKGPFWAQKGLAVTDAEIVYLTLDVSGEKPYDYISDALTYINQGKLKSADSSLAKLTDSVVSMDEEVALPLDKARDNIALARYFVAAGNYDGARYSLRHADNALEALEDDEAYIGRRPAIVAMRKEVDSLQRTIKRNDPTLMEKTDEKLQKWWNDLKDWTSANS